MFSRKLVPAAILFILVTRGALADDAPSLDFNEDDAAPIRQTVDSYVDAYNRGDAQAVADHWCESGEWVSPSGQRVQGKAAIRAEMETLFRDEPRATIEVVRPAIRFLTPDVAVEEGTVHVVRPNNEEPSDSTYIAIHVKRDGDWKLDSVRETSIPEPSLASPELQDLEWLVGRWIDQSNDSAVEANVAWTKNKKFLNWSFKVSVPGIDDLEGTQVIGWDPAAGAIRSWMFDSDGGFGAGTWSRRISDGGLRSESQWIVTFSQVLPDGRSASATNIYTRVDDDTYTWQSIDRKVDGESIADVEEVTIVRQAE